MLEVYIKEGCPYCDQQLDALKAKGISFKLYNVSHDAEALKKAREDYGAKKVPLVVENGALKYTGFGGGG